MRERSSLDTLVIAAAVASMVVGAWLVLVISTVLPDRDPGMIGPWTAVAVGLLGYAGLTFLALVSRRPSTMLRRSLLAASGIAVVCGLILIVGTLARTDDFEGYVLLIGLVLVGHGVAVLLDAMVLARNGSRTRQASR